MADKKFLLIGYVVLGIVLAAWPVLVPMRQAVARGSPGLTSRVGWLPTGALSLALLALGAAAPSLLVVAAAFAALAQMPWPARGPRDRVELSLATALGILAAGSIPWWIRSGDALDVSPAQILAIVALGVLAYTLLKSEHPAGKPVTLVVPGAFVLVALVLSFSTGILQQGDGIVNAWHHWGAYIGPAEVITAGATIYRDVPVQYGAGPTTILVAICGTDCWPGMYWLAASTTFLYAAAIFSLAWAVGLRTAGGRVFTALACGAACFLWTAYPSALVTPVATPSTSGLRFLPATLLTVYLVHAGGAGLSRRKQVIAFALWAVACLWAPESAFYASFVWWPFYLFIHRRDLPLLARTGRAALGAAKLATVAIALALLLATAFAVVHGNVLRAQDVLVYALFPPGVLPVNWGGPIAYFLSCIAVSAWVLGRQWRAAGDTPQFRQGLVVHLLCYATASYFLGRSHDNNLLNLFPLVVPVLAHAMNSSGAPRQIAAIAAAALIAWLPAFGWSNWRASIQEGSFLSLDPHGVVHRMGFTQRAVPLRLLQARSQEPVTVLNQYMNIVPGTPAQAWNVVHSPANFAFMPSEYRQRYLRNTAQVLRRSGWLVVSKEYEQGWLADFEAAYRTTDVVELGPYRALQLVPRN
jgi:uncharacterized membrane protein